MSLAPSRALGRSRWLMTFVGLEDEVLLQRVLACVDLYLLLGRIVFCLVAVFFAFLDGSRPKFSRNGRTLGRVGHDFHASCSVSVNECLAVLRPPVLCLAR